MKARHNDECKSLGIARNNDRHAETLNDDLLIARIARRVTKACLAELGIRGKGSSKENDDDIEVQSLASGKASARGIPGAWSGGALGQGQAASEHSANDSEPDENAEDESMYELDQMKAANTCSGIFNGAQQQQKKLGKAGKAGRGKGNKGRPGQEPQVSPAAPKAPTNTGVAHNVDMVVLGLGDKGEPGRFVAEFEKLAKTNMVDLQKQHYSVYLTRIAKRCLQANDGVALTRFLDLKPLPQEEAAVLPPTALQTMRERLNLDEESVLRMQWETALRGLVQCLLRMPEDLDDFEMPKFMIELIAWAKELTTNETLKTCIAHVDVLFQNMSTIALLREMTALAAAVEYFVGPSSESPRLWFNNIFTNQKCAKKSVRRVAPSIRAPTVADSDWIEISAELGC